MMNNIRVWDIEYGGVSREDILLELAKSKIALNAYATLLFLNKNLVMSDAKSRTNVISITPMDLGINEKSTFNDICNESSRRGLQLCPLEIAPILRLAYLDQKEGPILTVASKGRFQEDNLPNGFYLHNTKDSLWLRGYTSSEDWLWDQTSKFAFVEPNA